MFHLYFGAFDIVLYTGAIYGAMALSKVICDDLEQGKTIPVNRDRSVYPNHDSNPSRSASIAPR
jgi:hypothetical protein